MAGITHTKVSAKVDDPSYEVSSDEWNDEHTIDEGTARIYSGLDAAKPSGVKGNLFLATDTLILYRHTGAVWQEIARAESKIRLAQLSEKSHASLTDVTPSQHHTATVAGDLNLADLAEKDHASLTNVLTDQHHTKYTDVEVESVITAELVDGQSIDNAIDALISTHTGITTAHHTKYTDAEVETIITAELVDGQSIDNAIDALISTHAGITDAHHTKYTDAEVETIITAELVDGQSIDNAIDALISTHTGITDAHHAKYTDGEAILAVQGEPTLDLEGDVTIATGKYLGLKGNAEIRFYDNGNYVGFEAPALGADQIWVLPDADGDPNDVLTTDGGGNLSWAAGGGGGAHTLDAGQTDVTITGVADNELLAYDTGSSEWINQTPIEAGLDVVAVTAVEAADPLNLAGAVTIAKDLQVNGGDIGIAADVDLIGLASGMVTFRHDIQVNETATFDAEHDYGNQSGTITLDWTNGNKQVMTLTGSTSITTVTDPAGPCNLILRVIQDATGGRTLAWSPAKMKWAAGETPVLSTCPNCIDVFAFYFDGTNYWGVISHDFS